jgi:hypothetical protein
MKVSIIDASGATQEVEITAKLYQEASDNRLTVAQLINRKYPTNAEKTGTAFEQMCAGTGLFIKPEHAYGIRPPTLESVLQGTGQLQAGVITREANPASRILFPAVFLELVENKLKADTGAYVSQFNSLVAITDSIAGPRFDQPVINFSAPEVARSQGVGQNVMPPSMMSVTVSDISRKIPTFSLGMEISKEAQQASTLDLVALALARQAETERAARVDEQIAFLVSGDADMGQSALSSITATSLDSTIASAAGVMSHKAWVKYLRRNYRKRHIDWIMCDLNAALAIENRTGKPVVTTDNPTSQRIDALATVSNPQWQAAKIFLLEDGIVAANTIVGLDSRYAIRRVRNTNADYAATEEFVLKKSDALRFDFGEVMYRLFDEAWDVVTLT